MYRYYQERLYVGLKRDCKNYVDICKRCSEKKEDRGPPAPPLLPQTAGGPGDVLVIDIDPVYMSN